MGTCVSSLQVNVNGHDNFVPESGVHVLKTAEGINVPVLAWRGSCGVHLAGSSGIAVCCFKWLWFIKIIKGKFNFQTLYPTIFLCPAIFLCFPWDKFESSYFPALSGIGSSGL